MLVKDETQQASVDADYFADLDDLVYRVVSGHTMTEVGLRRRLAEVAEAHGRRYIEARVHLALRFKLLRKEGAIKKKRSRKIPNRVRPFLGLHTTR